MAPTHVLYATPANPPGWPTNLLIESRLALVATTPDKSVQRFLPAWWEQGVILRVAETGVGWPFPHRCEPPRRTMG